MLITFHCAHCRAKLRINANAMGSSLTCPECDGEIHVPRMRLGPGFVVGGFLIKHKLGEGGMGEVYLAKQLSLERDVALKILPSRFTRENSFVVRFLKEVHYQAKLDHPNIVAAHDAGEDNGVYFMAMAYVPGETLEERLNREGPMGEEDALQIVRQVGLALQYASEQKGILHRDIKPANIMVTPTLHAKVLDMGLSKNTLEKKSTTLADTLLGTPNYMSPEQIDHPRDIDTRSDLFSLGMTLYHMLTGQIPFEDTSYLETLNRHAKDKLEDPRALMPGVSESVSRLLARMLARDPGDRYADWNAFLDDLQKLRSVGYLPAPPRGESTVEVLSPEPGGDEPAPPSSPFGPGASSPLSGNGGRRRPLGVLVSVLIGLLLGLLGIFVLSMVLPRPKAPPPRPTAVPTAVPTSRPAPTATPAPTPTPSVDLDALRRELTATILHYERNPVSFDLTLEELLDLGTRGEGTPVAESAARQILRVRRDRDRAVEDALRRLRENTLRILHEQGAGPARAFLDGHQSPFPEETADLRSKLRRRVRAWEQQERSQREAEERTARTWLEKLHRQLAPLVLKRDWPGAIELVDQAAGEPALFAVSEKVAALRRGLLALQSVPDAVIASYKAKLNQTTLLDLRGGEVSVRILELRPDGLLAGKILLDEDGTPYGTMERFIPFSELGSEEILDQLGNREGAEFDIYRALMAQRDGNREACRRYLERADTPLARALVDHLFKPAGTPTPGQVPPPESDPPLNRPRFSPRPRLESL